MPTMMLGKMLKPQRGPKLQRRKSQLPVDIRDEIRILHNPDFQPSPQFSILLGQFVVRKNDLRKRLLEVIGYHEAKLFLNDLSLAKESEVVRIYDAD